MENELKYRIEIALNQVIPEVKKTALMKALGDAVSSVLGPTGSGTVLVYTPKK